MHEEETGAAEAEAGAVGARGPVEPARITDLIREHYTPALRYAARLLGDPAEAEDCVQEAFAEAFSNLGSLRDPVAAPAWLRSIVRHRCARRSRRRDLELLSPGGGPDEARGGEERGFRMQGRDERSAEERMARLALARLLVASLPSHEREIVLLFYVKECTQREIASFLGLPPSTVNNRLHDARGRMKQWERHMETSRVEPAVEASDTVSRVGTIVSARGPLIEARFEAEVPVSLFDALAVVDGEGRCVERMKIAHWQGDGRVVCLSTSKDAVRLDVGTSVLNTGKVGLELTRFGGVRGVSSADLQAAATALRGGPGEQVFQPTGIKAVDLLCPLPARGVVAQAATSGVGRIVLLDEIARRLAGAETALAWLCLVDRSEPDAYRGWDETTIWGRSGGLGFYWALSDQGTDPECAALDTCDATLYLSPLLAVHGLYPAIDAEHSRSTLLSPALVGEAHCTLAARAREELVFLKRASADPVLLELLAARAIQAAQRRALARVAAERGEDTMRLARARKLQRFLTQPFGVAREVTGWSSVDVSIAETLSGVRAILDGEVDELPEGAFAYAGSLDDVRGHARDGVERRYGR